LIPASFSKTIFFAVCKIIPIIANNQIKCMFPRKGDKPLSLVLSNGIRKNEKVVLFKKDFGPSPFYNRKNYKLISNLCIKINHVPFQRKMIPGQIGWRGSLIANMEDYLEFDQRQSAGHLDHHSTKMRLVTILVWFFKIMFMKHEIKSDSRVYDHIFVSIILMD
jgi:hypothetical protein